jgi:hypothetical protein
MIGAITAANLATLITAIATLVAAVGTIVLGVVNRSRLGKVHEAVNGEAQRKDARVDQLTRVMDEHGIPIPPTHLTDQPESAA